LAQRRSPAAERRRRVALPRDHLRTGRSALRAGHARVARRGPHEQLPTRPFALEALADLDGDGNVELVQLTGPTQATTASIAAPGVHLFALGYAETSNVFYQVGPITRFGGASSFYRLEETEAFDGGIESVTSDAYHLVAEEVTDAV